MLGVGLAPQQTNEFTSFPTKMSVGPAEVVVIGFVAEKSIGDPAATAGRATGAAGHVMEAEIVAPDKGKQDLPSEGAATREMSVGS